MATTKKTPAKKAAAPTKKRVAKSVAPVSALRKQTASASVSAAREKEQFTLILSALFCALSLLFVIISYWRYRM